MKDKAIVSQYFAHLVPNGAIKKSVKATDERLSEIMGNYKVTFAKTLEPITWMAPAEIYVNNEKSGLTTL